MKKKKDIETLLTRYVAGECTEDEIAWVETWYNRQETDTFTDLTDKEIEQDLLESFKNISKVEAKGRFPWYRVVAAVLLIGLSAGIYVYFNSNVPDAHLQVVKTEESLDILPGGNRAILTLSDGTAIYLDDVSSGQIAQQEGLSIDKTAEGLVTYSIAESVQENKSEAVYNTISTPKGGQYQVVLSDGTKVMLNAESSFTFPTTFVGNTRAVELEGEGYFEVNPKRSANSSLVPFIVTSGNQRVKVLGTQFNINAYADEPVILTTLLEGSVEVSDLLEVNKRILKPNEQSTLSNGNHLTVAKVQGEQAVSWKNGMFHFQGKGIQEVMRQLSRWYDVDVEFEGELPEIKLWGEVYRNVNASEALEILAYFNLNYKIINTNKGSKIVIY